MDTGDGGYRAFRGLSLARDGGGQIGSERYRELNYEMLIDDPEGFLRSLCQFVDLGYRPSMLGYANRAEQLIKASDNPQVHGSLRRPPTKGLRDWRTQMPPEGVEEFEGVAGEPLRNLGYDVRHPAPR